MNRTLESPEISELEKQAAEMIRLLESLYERMNHLSDEEILDEYSKIFLDHPPIAVWDI